MVVNSIADVPAPGPSVVEVLVGIVEDGTTGTNCKHLNTINVNDMGRSIIKV